MSEWLPDDDILKRRPDLLSESLNRYRRLISGGSYAFWEWNLADNTYVCEGSFWRRLGYEPMIYSNVDNIDYIQEYIHPDDFPYVDNIIHKHLQDNSPINMIYRIRAVNGEYCWTQATGSSTRNESGRVDIITGINFDLSYLKDTEKALRESEARNKRVLADSNDGIWEWSAIDGNDNPKKAGRKGKFYTSYSCWYHLGYSDDEVDSLPEDERLSIWRSHIHPHDLDMINTALKKYLFNRLPMDVEYRMIGSKGEVYWIRSRGRGGFNSFGRMILFSGININITKEKNAEEQVRRAKEQAEKANAAKTQFLSSMSHELRTPLNSIIGFSQLLSTDKTLSDDQKDNIRMINNAGQYLLSLVNDVLDLGKIEAGKLSLDIKLVSVRKLVQDCLDLLSAEAKKKSIKLWFDPGASEDLLINADEVRLSQCLLNLISNGIKYGHINGSVYIEFSRSDEEMIITVEDDGQGIDKEHIPHLFEAFNRLGAEKSSIQGSGVGLVVTKQIVESMGGSIAHVPGTRKGACFNISFPILDGEKPESSKSMGEESTKSEQAKDENISLALNDRRVRNILYVEDNPLNIKVLKSWLNLYPQLNLIPEQDPMMALYKIRSSQPDLILMDIHLPEVNGKQMLDILKRSPETEHIPIVAVSAGAMESDIKEAKESGFDDYLTKPIDFNVLIQTFNRLLSSEPKPIEEPA